MTTTFAGSYVALPTPFRGSGVVDMDAFRRLVECHAAGRTAGIVVTGTTGESVTLSERERRGLLQAAVQFAAGRLQVVAGVGTNATASSVALARHAAESGADALLVVTPYYNRPSRLGLMRHFGAVAEAAPKLPVMLYNVPSRTACDLKPEWARDLARHCANIVALKEATGDPARIAEVCAIDELEVLCGEDSAMAAFQRAGAVGSVNVVGNLLPDLVADLLEASAPGGDQARADALTARAAPLVRALFIESNPVPVKSALAWVGLCRPTVRGPLAPLEDAHRIELEAVLRTYGQELSRLDPAQPEPTTR